MPPPTRAPRFAPTIRAPAAQVRAATPIRPPAVKPGSLARTVRPAGADTLAGGNPGGAGWQGAPPLVRLPSTNGGGPPPSGLPDQASQVLRSPGPGEPLPPQVAEPISRSVGADLQPVRIHSDARSAAAARSLSARAFTWGRHIFLGRGEQPTNLGLVAHEAAHVVQQQGASPSPIQRWSSGQGDRFESEAHQASSAVLRGAPFTVQERTSAPRVQRLGLSDALNYFADKANLIPGFRMFTIILGVNPINMSRVERSAANILRALIEFMPGGGLITQALDNSGVFDKVGAWVEQQIQSLAMTGSAIKQAISDFLDSLSWTDILDLGGVWERAKRIFTEPIDRLINFAKGVVTGIIGFIKDAILMPIAKLAEGTRGYDLLRAVLGKDPVTGEPYPRTAETLVGGFMKLIGKEEIWENIKKANAIARVWAWFQGALESLMGFLRQIPTLFVNAFKALELLDIVLVPRAFAKLVGVFGNFIGNFISWAGNAVWNLLQIVFEVVAPGAIPYLKKAAAAFRTILSNPIGFVGNLVKAGKKGFQQFADNIGAHLKKSLISWLTGSLAGANIYIPNSFELREIVKFVLSVLGLTWQNIRQKLVKVVGEPAVKAMEVGFDIVVTLVTQGPAAAWEKIKEQLSNLKDMVMDAIMSYVIETIVKKAVAKVISLLVPGGAFVQAIISIYDTIMVFIAKLQQIIQVAMAFIDSISAIASGVIGAAANKVEQVLAGLLTLAISFLAGFLGLGKIADKVINILNTKVRQPIDKALDKVIDWIVTTARRIGRFITGRGGAQPAAVAPAAAGAPAHIGEDLQFAAGGEGHHLWIAIRGETADVMLASTPKPLSEYLTEFRTDARDIEDNATKTQVLGWIGTALPLARSIEADSRRAASRQIDTPQRNALDQRIDANEETLRPVLANILNTLGVHVPGQITPPIAVHFITYPGIDLGEYRRQLGMQQSAINAMFVQDWITNRMRFAERRAFTGSGRHPESQQAQQDLRARTRQQLILRLTRGMNATGPVVSAVNADSHLAGFVAGVFASYAETTRRNGLAESTATREVDAWLRTQHALHSPDQVAGGRFDQLTGLGAGSVNTDIGKNWGGFEKPVHLANQLHRDTLDAMRRLNVRRAFYRQVRMNVTLTV